MRSQVDQQWPYRRDEAADVGRQCRILSYRHGSSQTLGALPQKELSVAVPRVLHGMGRRDRWVIVQLRSSDEEGQWVGWCSHPDCMLEEHRRAWPLVRHTTAAVT